MEISLVRHGRSVWKENNRITCKALSEWIKNYDTNGVIKESYYPVETIEQIAKSKLVITSDLVRSIESAKILNPKIEIISNPVFRETELPNPLFNFWGLKFSPSVWLIILRCLWFSGYSRKCESLSEAKKRAIKASEQLIKYANDQNSIVLVGHGFFNMLLGKELKRNGWKSKEKTNAKHWHCNTYFK